MNIRQKNSYKLDLAAGNVAGKEYWNKFGETEVDTIVTTIWSGSTQSGQGGKYIYPDYAELGTPVTMNLVSTSAADTAKDVEITGLDKNWKLQTEVLTLNGTTVVPTVYQYIRVFRMSCFNGGDLIGSVHLQELPGGADKMFAHIENGVNQTEAAIYSVPLGHDLFVDTIVISPLDKEPVKIWPVVRNMVAGYTNFAKKLGWNIAFGPIVGQSEYAFPIPQGSDLELRGIATASKSADVACNLFGQLTQNNSVPIDIENFSAVAGDTIISLVWDEQTPAETSDMRSFEVSWSQAGSEIGMAVIREHDAASYTITGLVNDLEYDVEIVWVGYDGLKSAVSTATATPIELPLPLVSALSQSTTAGYIESADSGVNWTTESIPGYTGVEGMSLVSDDEHIYAAVEVTEGVFEASEYTDGAWSTPVATTFGSLSQVGDFILRAAGTASESKIGSASWATTNTTQSSMVAGQYNSDYVIYDDTGDVLTAADAVTFASIGNDGSAAEAAFADDTAIITVYGTATTSIGFGIYDGSWSTATTTITVVAEDYEITGLIGFNNKYFMTALDGGTPAGLFYVSSDGGDNWVNTTIPGTDLFPFALSVTDGKLFMSLVDASFDGWICSSVDGVTFSTPVKVATGEFPRQVV